MNTLRPIDLATWRRRETFEHYRTAVPCSYSLTVDMDVTELNRALTRTGRKTYPAHIWVLATAVNRREEFRLALTDRGEAATWDVVHPAFTVFNPEQETFAALWSPYNPDFGSFHEAVVEKLRQGRAATQMFPESLPQNVFDISSLPWTSFTAFTLHISGAQDHLLPIFTLGRHREQDGQQLLPVSLQVHHAAADGFHSARLLADVEALVQDPAWIG